MVEEAFAAVPHWSFFIPSSKCPAPSLAHSHGTVHRADKFRAAITELDLNAAVRASPRIAHKAPLESWFLILLTLSTLPLSAHTAAILPAVHATIATSVLFPANGRIVHVRAVLFVAALDSLEMRCAFSQPKCPAPGIPYRVHAAPTITTHTDACFAFPLSAVMVAEPHAFLAQERALPHTMHVCRPYVLAS